MQLLNDYAKDPENSSYPKTLVEAHNLTICWEGNRKINNRYDRGRDRRSVNFYNNDGRGRGNNNNYDRRDRGNKNRDRDNNNNNESDSEPSDRLCHGEA